VASAEERSTAERQERSGGTGSTEEQGRETPKKRAEEPYNRAQRMSERGTLLNIRDRREWRAPFTPWSCWIRVYVQTESAEQELLNSGPNFGSNVALQAIDEQQ
jgi:hypothetical protein